MKLLLLLEHLFFLDDKGNLYSEGVIDDNYLKRYLSVFDSVFICARTKIGIMSDSDKRRFNIRITDERIKVLPLPYAVSSKEIILNYFKTKKLFKEYLKSTSLVLLRGPSLLSLLLYKNCINKKVYGVEFVMGANEILNPKNIIRKLINKILDGEAKKMCYNANGVSYVTTKILQEDYPSYSIVNGEDKYHFNSNYSSLDLYKDNFYLNDWKNDEKPDIINIIHIGSMANERKGQLRLLEAFNILINKNYNIKLHFLGDGKNIDILKEYVNSNGLTNNVIFYGNVNDRKKIFEIIRNCHLFVLPTSSEGLPRSIIEAMANSLPCLASNVDGIPELLEKDCLFDYNNISEIVDKIENMLNDWERMIVVGKRNFEFAKQFDYEILNKRRVDFYHKLKRIREDENE